MAVDFLMMRFRILFFLFLVSFTTLAQQRVWVFFKDKITTDTLSLVSPACIENRNNQGINSYHYSDQPVSDKYTYTVLKAGAKFVNHSKWLNAICVDASETVISSVKQLPFVQSVVAVSGAFFVTTVNRRVKSGLTVALEQMDGKAFLAHGLDGKGVVIGIVDAGFHNANTHGSLLPVFKKKQVLGTKDFLDSARTDFYSEQTALDFHGRRVMELIAGKARKNQIGFASGAEFYLARSENGKIEFRGEEHAWVRAMEWFDSLGVRLVNTSLGYGTGFSDTLENYHISDMNGTTTVVAKAARIATEEKGMFVVVSAGNEGNKPNWKIVSSPADAPGVLTVGAVKANREKAGYSSIGPAYNTYIKPNVAAYSLTGTSFSAPEVTGFVACLMEKAPKLSSRELMKVMEQCSHLYPYPNNYVGYGIPSAIKALELLNGKTIKRNNLEIHTSENEVQVDFKADTAERKSVVIYHKENATTVKEMLTLNKVSDNFIVERKNMAVRTTVDMGNRLVEIFWTEK